MPHIPHTLKGINNIYGRTAELPCGRAHALPSTLSSLLSTLGSPLHSGHALPSALSSLLSTLDIHLRTHGRIAVRARPRAPTTHYLLLPSPYSLLFRTVRRMPHGARSSAPSTHCPLPSPPYSLLWIFIYGRTAELPCGRAHARQPRTTFSSLLPTLYFSFEYIPLRGGDCRSRRQRPDLGRRRGCPVGT